MLSSAINNLKPVYSNGRVPGANVPAPNNVSNIPTNINIPNIPNLANMTNMANMANMTGVSNMGNIPNMNMYNMMRQNPT